MSWYVYLLSCADNTYYTGVTTDPRRRLLEHNGERAGGARYTRARRPVKMVYFELCDDRAEACAREYEIRKLDRRRKTQLAASMADQIPQSTPPDTSSN